MKLSELRACFEGNHELYAEYLVLLVDLDLVPSDGVDVVISPLFAMAAKPDTAQLLLYSAAAMRSDGDEQPLAIFEQFVGALPLPGVYEVDFEVMLQLPIAPEAEEGDDPEADPPLELGPLAGVWIGRESEEIWLLVRPQSEYPTDILPD